jgi:hypothetical protein
MAGGAIVLLSALGMGGCFNGGGDGCTTVYSCNVKGT